jgi:perosamine synthetase
LGSLADSRGLALVADACHSLGAMDRGRKVGTLARLTAFSFHPVKHIATGEGGMVTTDDPELAAAMRRFRNHGIDTDHRQRAARGTWYYEMVDLGCNYRLSDIHCALGLSQLRKLPGWLARRRQIARRYDAELPQTGCTPLRVRPDAFHSYHLYVVRVPQGVGRAGRDTMFAALRAEGIGVNVHYSPVHLHPFYRQHLRTGPGMCPIAEAAADSILSLPMFPGMDDADVETVIAALARAAAPYAEPAA